MSQPNRKSTDAETTTEKVSTNSSTLSSPNTSSALNLAIDSAAYFIVASTIVYVLFKGSQGFSSSIPHRPSGLSAFQTNAMIPPPSSQPPPQSSNQQPQYSTPPPAVQSPGASRGLFGSIFRDQSGDDQDSEPSRKRSSSWKRNAHKKPEVKHQKESIKEEPQQQKQSINADPQEQPKKNTVYKQAPPPVVVSQETDEKPVVVGGSWSWKRHRKNRNREQVPVSAPAESKKQQIISTKAVDEKPVAMQPAREEKESQPSKPQVQEIKVEKANQEKVVEQENTQSQKVWIQTDETLIDLIKRVVEVETLVVQLAGRVMNGNQESVRKPEVETVKEEKSPINVAPDVKLPDTEKVQAPIEITEARETGWVNQVSESELVEACTHLVQLKEAVISGKSKTAQLVLNIIQENGGCGSETKEPLLANLNFGSMWVSQQNNNKEEVGVQNTVLPLRDFANSWKKKFTEVFVEQ
ncbi:UNVERIFIED_CONTAM: hypothetical protein HDU68_005818 [Siphonaria sp. JEL0065]|nr:hypothetical protein HDU68_005818 [Siphonaria sp. JEL0065]